MKKIILIIFFLILYSVDDHFIMHEVDSVNIKYELLNFQMTSKDDVVITLKTFSNIKKAIDYEADCAALKIVLFDGHGNKTNSKPLLNGSEKENIKRHPVYFENLFAERLSDFITSHRMISRFREGGHDKSTIYKIGVDIQSLKKDIMANGISR